MEAHKRTLIQNILAQENWQFIVPIYQRAYKWTEEECSRLVSDIIKCGKSGKEHFVGSVVYQSPDKNIDFSDIKFYLVDGQQRLTTMLLITKALNLIANDCVKTSTDKGESNPDASYVASKTKKILYIDIDDRNRGYKIKPSKKDKSVFDAIVMSSSLDELENNPNIQKSSHMYNNFMKAYTMLKTEIESGTNIKETIYEHGMLNLTAVEIVLTYDEDAQEIFESINSLGVELSNSDLIRNYLLMSNSNQQAMFTEYWEPMQDIIIGENNMETFVQHYLHMKKETTINERNVYKEYVSLSEKTMRDEGLSKDDLLKDLYNMSLIYEPFIKTSSNYSTTTNQLMKEFRDMNQSTAYPFLMKVFLDRKSMPDKVSEETLNKVINLLIVYVVRRTICGVSTNSLRGFMLSLYRRVFKVAENYDRYYESIYAYLDRITTNDYLRSADEMREALVKAPIYNNLRFATYLLFKIENGRYPNVYSESVSAQSPTIEHIMPQTLTGEWIDMFEEIGEDPFEIHNMYLNTLGNLSLSSRAKNSVMSNENFDFKKNVLCTDGSKFVVLNKDIPSKEKFTTEEILEREARLSEIVLSKYSIEHVDTSGIKFDENIEIIGSEDANEIFLGATPISFKLLGVEEAVDSYSRVLLLSVKALLRRYPERIRELAASGYNPWNNETDARAYLHFGKELEKDQHIGENIYIHPYFNANYSVQFVTLLMKQCGLEADELSIYLKKSSIKKEHMVSKNEKVSIIRSALTKLADEGTIIYDYDLMPKLDSWIKFRTIGLDEIFSYDGTPTSWDGSEKHASAYYVEYNVAKHRVVITLKKSKATMDLYNHFVEKIDSAGIEESDSATYWHMKSYDLDFSKVLEYYDVSDSSKSVEELYCQLKKCVAEIEQWKELVSR